MTYLGIFIHYLKVGEGVILNCIGISSYHLNKIEQIENILVTRNEIVSGYEFSFYYCNKCVEIKKEDF